MHLRQLPSGSWRVIVSHEGHKRSGTAKSKREAQILGGRLLEELGRLADDDPALIEFLHFHLDHLVIATTTRADYSAVLARVEATDHALLKAPISEVTTGRLVAFYRHLSQHGWSDHRLTRLHTIISGAFTTAVKWDMVARNPARSATPRAPQAPDIVVPSNEDVRRLIDAAGDFAPMVHLLASCGMRREELVGLQWGDIDFDQASMKIARAVVYTPESGLEVKELKNSHKGERVISLDPDTLALLRRLRGEAKEQAFALSVPFDDQWWIFGDRKGRPRRPDYVTSRFVDLRDSLGLTLRLYDLRHWMISTLLAAGMPPAQVAGRAGHDVQTMLRRYWHFVPASDQTQADYLGDVLAAGNL
jgi:integrase